MGQVATFQDGWRLSRRRWLHATAGAVVGGGAGFASVGADAAEATSAWSWKQLVAHTPGGAGVPVPRDPWNGMLAYKRSLYLLSLIHI